MSQRNEHKNCIFCNIIDGNVPCFKVFETADVIAFAPKKETIIARGHLLIIPKEHIRNFYDISKNQLSKLLHGVKEISMKLKTKYHVNGINILHASGEIAQQSVFHFHLHLIPRYKDDGLDLWPTTGYQDDNYPSTYIEMASILL